MSGSKKGDYANIKLIGADHPDLHVFQNKAREDVIFTNFAYGQEEEQMQKMAEQIPGNFQLLMMSDHIMDTKDYSYRSVVFIDYESKEIVFANAGTRVTQDIRMAHDLLDDAMLVLQTQPFKMSQSAALNDMVLDSLGNAAKEFKFHYTGHSLGAAMAEMSAADMDIKMQKRGVREKGAGKQISAVTFENPGTLPILETMYDGAGISKDNIKDLNLCEFNNRKNMINSLNKQAGRKYTIVPSDQEARTPNLIQRVAAYAAKTICKYSYTKVGRLVGKAFSLLAPGGATMNLLDEHALKNFDEIFVQEKGVVRNKEGDVITIEEAYSGVKPIQYDKEVYDELAKLKDKNNNVDKQEYTMNAIDPDTLDMNKVAFSKVELQTVAKQLDILEKSAIKQNTGIETSGKKSFASMVGKKDRSNIKSMAQTKKVEVAKDSSKYSKKEKSSRFSFKLPTFREVLGKIGLSK